MNLDQWFIFLGIAIMIYVVVYEWMPPHNKKEDKKEEEKKEKIERSKYCRHCGKKIEY